MPRPALPADFNPRRTSRSRWGVLLSLSLLGACGGGGGYGGGGGGGGYGGGRGRDRDRGGRESGGGGGRNDREPRW